MAAPTQGILVAGTKRFGFTFLPYSGQLITGVISDIIGMGSISGPFYAIYIVDPNNPGKLAALSNEQLADILIRGGSQVAIVLDAAKLKEEVAFSQLMINTAKQRLVQLGELVSTTNTIEEQNAVINNMAVVTKTLTLHYGRINRYNQLFG